ncbi:hypothetical protein BKA61DRAFT_630861 [Leptodontidium sp. MPI-SDFR-AT-0119]|nr:hypothetical protein BKA61DRAFT_630861 [Leptodontidium sp. MPI-SDFR-AT-0119]
MRPYSNDQLSQPSRNRWWQWTPSKRSIFILLILAIVLVLGIIGVARLVNNITRSQSTIVLLQSLQPFPADFTRDIIPITCHSHNDYWRHIPLLDAISAGCASVEADIWVSTGRPDILNKTELYVGHSADSLRPECTFESLYIDPLVYILDQTNGMMATPPPATAPIYGIFETNPNSTMVLLVDFKNSPRDTDIWSLFQNQLQPLREKRYLTYWNATRNERVVTGDAPFDLVNNSTTNLHHDVFFDAPLLELEDDAASPSPKYTSSTSYYASVDLSKAVGKVWFSMTNSQQAKIEKQAAAARDLGLLSRYWDTPSWPMSVRNNVWEQLLLKGAGVLNVDELWTASKKDWRLCSAVGWGICP